MTREEFSKVRAILKMAFKNFLNDEAEEVFWYGNLKRYDAKLVEEAAMNYIQQNEFEPKIASLIKLIRHEDSSKAFNPRYETLPDGRQVQVIQCQRCRDTGLMTWENEDGNLVGKPCDCPAGHAKYKWGWMTEEEQKESVARNILPSAVVGENWYEQ